MKKFVLIVVPTIENAYHRFKDFVACSIPIGLLSIAAVLEKEGYPVKFLDADAQRLTFNEAVELIVKAGPDYIGSTTMTATMDITENFFAEVKKRLPDVTVIVGGPHVSALPPKTLEESKAIDIVVKGEGEDTIVELMNALAHHQTLSKVAGIAFKENGKVVETQDRELIKDLGKLPLPAYHLLKYDLYRSYGWNKWVDGYCSPLGVVFTGRGCYGKCNFCATKVIFGHRIRYFPIQRIQDEIDLLVNQYQIRILYFQDDTFTANRTMVDKICDYIIQKGYHRKLQIMVSSRVETIHVPILQKMRKAGVRWICFGVESGNQYILDRMKKNIVIGQIKDAFKKSREAGLFIAGNYMIGHLGETHETAMDTIRLACDLDQDYASFAIAIPLPGTELYQHCLDHEIPLPSWTEFGSVNTPPIPLNESLTAEQLMNLRRLATRKFFERPVYFAKLVWRFRPIPVIRDFVKMYFAMQEEIKANRY